MMNAARRKQDCGSFLMLFEGVVVAKFVQKIVLRATRSNVILLLSLNIYNRRPSFKITDIHLMQSFSDVQRYVPQYFSLESFKE